MKHFGSVNHFITNNSAVEIPFITEMPLGEKHILYTKIHKINSVQNTIKSRVWGNIQIFKARCSCYTLGSDA